jgi:hypothetical protein
MQKTKILTLVLVGREEPIMERFNEHQAVDTSASLHNSGSGLIRIQNYSPGSSGSRSRSGPKHSLFHNANDFKGFFNAFKAYFSKKMSD